MKYRIIRLSDAPEMKESMADWFSSRWGIPREAYIESMNACLERRSPVPEWYAATDGGRIIGGLGLIENDFHSRKDLTPNVCAVFTDPEYRGRGIAASLLNRVCSDAADGGISTLYLLTCHEGFYERCGWRFLCMVQGDGDEQPSRMYAHSCTVDRSDHPCE